MNAIIITVGDELTAGEVIDRNSAYLSRQLSLRGIKTASHRTVGDCVGQIASAIAAAAQQAELVLVSGGLGPTADDLSRQGLTEAMGSKLVLNRQCLAQIEAFFRHLGRTMTPANRIQAMIPAGASPLENRLGTAPGIAVSLGKARIFLMPGVPEEMEAMFHNCIAPRLPTGTGAILQKVIHTFGLGESDIASRLGELMRRDAETLIGTTVYAGMVSVRITARAEGPEAAAGKARKTVMELRRRLGELIVGEDQDTMASVVGELLRRRGQTLTTAESCTGGLLGEMITSVPGSSDYYVGGFVAYSNDIKRDALGVAEELLSEHGSVSEPVAGAMAANCRNRLGSDWAAAITGIAGPGGGSGEKPVGLVYIGLAGPSGVEVHRHLFAGSREIIRRRAALTALNYLRGMLMEGKA